MRITRYASFSWVLLFLLVTTCKNKTLSIKTTTVVIDSLSQIVLLGDSLVQPIIYSQLHGLADKPVPQAKALFISALLPSILIVKRELREAREQLRNLKEKRKWNTSDSAYYHSLRSRYKASDVDNLLLRMETIPNSIVLAQAVVESGWGQSRFFLEGNNIFGMWSYNRDEPRLRAGTTREEQTVHVRLYNDLTESVRDYFEALGSAPAYGELRQALQQTRDPFELLPHLRKYSERREAYVQQLRLIIEQNNLTQYDHYRIDPQYMVEE